jgi:hypothetical protein
MHFALPIYVVISYLKMEHGLSHLKKGNKTYIIGSSGRTPIMPDIECEGRLWQEYHKGMDGLR